MKAQIFLLAFIFVTTLSAVAAPPAEEGKAIFAARCASCHNVNKTLTGPALAGLDERRSMDWIVKFVQSSQSLVKSGDKDAVAVFEKFNKIPMPDHSDLSADKIATIVEYIKTESKVEEAKAPFAKPSKLRPAYTPLSISNDYAFFIGFLAIVGLLIAVLLFAVQLKQYDRKHQSEV
jgi:cytochrome c551/c552